MELSKFTANCTQSARPCPESHKIHTIHADFPGFSISIGQIAKIRDIRALLYFHRFRMIHTRWETNQARANSAKSTINVLIRLRFIVSDVRQEKFEDPVWANYANSTTLRCNSQKIKFFKYFKFMVLSALRTY